MWEAKKEMGKWVPPLGDLQNKNIAPPLGGGQSQRFAPSNGGGKNFFAAFGRILPFFPPHSQKRGGATDSWGGPQLRSPVTPVAEQLLVV